MVAAPKHSPVRQTMQDLDEVTVTEAVLAQIAGTPDKRLREITDAAVRHLHAFAREVKLTPAEWLTGIKFLTEVGLACTSIRQEFILLSDVLGVSALVNALHDKQAPELGTQSSLLGPFYREGSPELPVGASIVSHPTAPEIVLYGRVIDAGGAAVPRAVVQVWQTNESGLYDLQTTDGEAMDLRATFRCDTEGRYHFRTVRPRGYSIPLDGPVGQLVQAQRRHGFRPSHIHFLIGAPGYRELVTALYFSDDEHIDTDTVFGVSRSLVISPKIDDPAAPIAKLPAVHYDFQLARAAAQEDGRVGADPSQIVKAAE
jgi:protocatechuate 3,4-dioxygenase beta subunit